MEWVSFCYHAIWTEYFVSEKNEWPPTISMLGRTKVRRFGIALAVGKTQIFSSAVTPHNNKTQKTSVMKCGGLSPLQASNRYCSTHQLGALQFTSDTVSPEITSDPTDQGLSAKNSPPTSDTSDKPRHSQPLTDQLQVGVPTTQSLIAIYLLE